jgi:putative inorganic carbon (HCO3(-)) transporter
MGDVLAGAGLFVAVFAAAAAMLWDASPRRSATMLIALVLIPVLILADQWHSPEITDLRDHVARFVALGAVAVIVVAVLTALFRRRPMLLPLAVIAAVPFRVPIHAGGQEANLLVPLYLVIAGGVLAVAWRQWEEHGETSSAGGMPGGEIGDAAASAGDVRAGDPRRAQDADASEHGGGGPHGRTRGQQLLPEVLAAVLILYALQSVYSEDFSRALQNVAFFYVPFALAFTLLAERRWDRRLLVLGLGVVAGEALLFVLFGFWEYAARHLIWNPEVIQSNDFHTYFRVNSLFWDPNIFGRYLALTITAIGAALLWARSPRLVLWLGALVAVLWLGLITTFSQSSFVALLVGLAALAALRWSARWTLAACAGGAILAVAFVLAAGGSLKINLSTEHTLNKDTSGRANLVSEGIALFGDRPLWGYGSGSFSVAYQKHRTGGNGRLSVSHTEPVTVAAEQGLLGLLAYLALLVVAFTTLARGFMGLMPGLRSPPSAGGATGPAASGLVLQASRAATFACFLALIAHTMAYAGFLEDPLTWVLLSIGGSLAVAPNLGIEQGEADSEDEVPTAPPAQAPA